MNSLLTRTLSGVVFVALVVGSFIGGPWYVAGLFFLFSMIASQEYVKLVNIRVVGVLFVLASLATYLISAGIALDNWDPKLFWLLTPVFIICAFVEIISKKNGALPTTARLTFGLLYIPIGFSFILHLSLISGSYDFTVPLGMIVLIWLNDTGAYLIGSAIGKNKLLPSVSPAKSWEGFIGGIAVAVIVAVLLSIFWESDLETIDWVFMALTAGIVGTMGDLFESKMKRLANVKDSGTLMPGHGGMLDRFDALLFVVQLVTAYFMIAA